MDYKIIMHIVEAAGGIDRYLNLFIDNFDNYKHIVVLSQNFNSNNYFLKPNVINVKILKMNIIYVLVMSELMHQLYY